MVDLITDPVFKAPTIKTVQTYVKHNVPTYFYQVRISIYLAVIIRDFAFDSLDLTGYTVRSADWCKHFHNLVITTRN